MSKRESMPKRKLTMSVEVLVLPDPKSGFMVLIGATNMQGDPVEISLRQLALASLGALSDDDVAMRGAFMQSVVELRRLADHIEARLPPIA